MGQRQEIVIGKEQGNEEKITHFIE